MRGYSVGLRIRFQTRSTTCVPLHAPDTIVFESALLVSLEC